MDNRGSIMQVILRFIDSDYPWFVVAVFLIALLVWVVCNVIVK